MKLKTALGAIVISILFFLGIIFALASIYAWTRLIVAAFLFVAGSVIAYYMSKHPIVLVY